MPLTSSKSVKRRPPRWTLLAIYAAIFASASATMAQEPIRVETNEVLVPVTVVDLDRELDMEADRRCLYQAFLGGDMECLYKQLEWIAVPNLTAADFRLFDDGKEREIKNVSSERSLYWNLRDNKGRHFEYIGTGGGKWSTTEFQPEPVATAGKGGWNLSTVIAEAFFPHYVLSYSLPESPEGSCHKVQVKVNRRHTSAGGRQEYCNTHHPASDPVKGSKLGNQLEALLAQQADGSIGISALAIPFSNGGTTRVHIVVDGLGKTFKDLSRFTDILGIVYNRADGALITRFSDDDGRDANRYDRQISLPPGSYELRVALGDGKKSGRAVLPFTVESINRGELAISQVAVCKLISDFSANARKLPGAWTGTLPENYVPLISNETEFYPTSDTRFKVGESLYAYFEVYAPQGEKSQNDAIGGIEIEIRIVDTKNGRIISDPQPISLTQYIKPGSFTIPIGRGIDISKVPKGSYRIELRAVGLDGFGTGWKGESFTVE